MDNPFEYPADRPEFFEGASEEESHFYFTLREFENLVRDHGVDFVLNRMDEETFDKLVTWFLDDEDEL